MDELVEFLRARLDEDEWIARAATPHYRKSENRSLWIHSDSAVIVTAEYFEDAAHIARHDPARVLREIEAKRQLLNEYAEVAEDDIDEPYEYGYGWANGLGRAVRLLALPYADHPDYREAWRP